MLVEFRVKNFALIDNLEINFKPGLNVLTGETGAGKSIIIGALDILLGARAMSDFIRRGAEKAVIEAVFEPERIEEINHYLKEVGLEPDPGILILSREIRSNGRNRARINGQVVTSSIIKEIRKFLVDIHGQHEHQSLLDPALHLQILDHYLPAEEEGLLAEIKTLFLKIKSIEKELAELIDDESEMARQLDLLEFQIEEIDKAQLKAGEFEELSREYKVLNNLEEIYAVTGEIYNRLQGEDFAQPGLLEDFGHFMKELFSIADFDPELNRIAEQFQDLYYNLENLALELQNYHEQLEFDQKRLKLIADRLDLLQSLQRKYGENVQEILAYREELSKKLEKLKSQDKIKGELNQQKEKLLQKYYQKACKLSQLRKKEARKLEKRISEELKELAMQDSVFKIDFQEKEAAGDGIDKVEFLISTNRGEELKSLSRIASGGELSRIMLALKSIIAHQDLVDTMVFDEVDTGVSGKTAQLMAEKLAFLGRKKQLICISHLPQIASMADAHYYIYKETKGNRTYTIIKPLAEKERTEEIARMLGGVKLTATTLKHAAEMLELAKKNKSSAAF